MTPTNLATVEIKAFILKAARELARPRGPGAGLVQAAMGDARSMTRVLRDAKWGRTANAS